MKKSTILVAICCMVLASCGGGGNSSPSGPVLRMNEYMKAGNYEKAVEYWVDNTDFSDADKPEAEMKNELKGAVALFSSKIKSEAEKHGGIDSFKVTAETIAEDGNSAEVEGVTTYKDGETEDQSIDMVRVDGKWMFENEK